MAKKYLLVDNEVIAKQKSKAALAARFPQRDADQLALHHSNPSKYPHPSQCTQYLNAWKKNPHNGMCELEVDEAEHGFYGQDDQGKMTSTRQIEDEQ